MSMVVIDLLLIAFTVCSGCSVPIAPWKRQLEKLRSYSHAPQRLIDRHRQMQVVPQPVAGRQLLACHFPAFELDCTWVCYTS
jgi:hypothetical protein